MTEQARYKHTKTVTYTDTYTHPHTQPTQHIDNLNTQQKADHGMHTSVSLFLFAWV